MMLKVPTETPRSAPRLAFLGVGWIGRNRMEAVLADGLAEACAVCDPSVDMVSAALATAPGVMVAETMQALLDTRPDGLVIATPSALHAEQSIWALENGLAVFCQKPLGRSKAEVAAVLEAGRRNDRLIGVDFSYRHTRAMQQIRSMIRANVIGHIYSVDLVFHNAYGPDKPWFYERARSGGGCVMDLGVHLVDLLLWTLDFPGVQSVRADLFAEGRRLIEMDSQVEDYAAITLGVSNGLLARLACSWRLHAGQDAVISATFYGTKGALVFSNVNGSFYNLAAEHHCGTSRTILVAPPDAWGGRAARDWARQLACNPAYDQEVQRFEDVAEIIDRIYLDAAEAR